MAKKNKNTENIALARVLRKISDERSLTLKQLSAMAEVPISVVQSWMAASSPQDLLAVKRLARGLGISFERLIFGEVESENIHLEDHFDEAEIFEGLCRVKIMRLNPRKSKG